MPWLQGYRCCLKVIQAQCKAGSVQEGVVKKLTEQEILLRRVWIYVLTFTDQKTRSLSEVAIGIMSPADYALPRGKWKKLGISKTSSPTFSKKKYRVIFATPFS